MFIFFTFWNIWVGNYGHQLYITLYLVKYQKSCLLNLTIRFSETLPVDRLSCREKGQPLCMEQYSRLFSCYRYPGIDKDRQVVATCSLTAVEPEHIIVISLNQIFVLDVVNNFTRLNEDQLYHQLRRIRLQSIAEENCHADVGFLTSMRRDEWGKARLELMKGKSNY